MTEITIIPLRGMIELRGFEVYFEVMESEGGQSPLPTPNDWWLERIVSKATGEELKGSIKARFELRHEDQIHWAIRDFCRQTLEETKYEHAAQGAEPPQFRSRNY